jgi:hypothetical protein
LTAIAQGLVGLPACGIDSLGHQKCLSERR